MSNYESDEVERLAAAFAALSNPQRLRMFIKLASTCCAPDDPDERRRGRATEFCCATEVGEGLELAPSTVSHHLKELRQAGLINVERQGRRIDCRASRDTLRRIASFFAAWSPAEPARARSARTCVASGGGRK